MKQMKQQFVDSWHELRHLKTVVVTAMLIAVGIILGYFSITVTPYLRIGFSFIANELTALLFGPVVGGVMGGIADIIKYLIKPDGPYFFGFTLSAILGPVIYGIMLYKKPLSFPRIFIAKVLVAVFVNLLLGTYWLSMLYGKGFLALLPARALKQVCSVPVEAALFYIIVKTLGKAHFFFEVRAKR